MYMYTFYTLPRHPVQVQCALTHAGIECYTTSFTSEKVKVKVLLRSTSLIANDCVQHGGA